MALIIDSAPLLTDTSAPVKINKLYIGVVCLVAAFGGLLFGFDLVIISGAIPFVSAHFSLDALSQGFAVGCINLGAAAGALMAGYFSDKWGRKKFLLACAILFIGTGVGTGWAGSFTEFIVFRMASGAAMGGAALVSPMYIAEIAPARYRGRLVAFYQLAIVTGLLLAYISNYLLLNIGADNWRWMFSSQAVPATLFFAGLLFVPESPRWLVRKHRLTKAAAVLTTMGGEQYSAAELSAIKKSFLSPAGGRWQDLFRSGTGKILFIGTMIAIFSQIAGQNSIMSYAPEILGMTGIGKESAFAQSILIGVVFFLFTFIAIGTVDRSGRRKLLLTGALLLTTCLMGVAVCFALHVHSGYWVLSFVLGFIATYSATLGPVTWITLSEIFPNRVRSHAMAVATLALWMANFFTTASFPIMRAGLGLPVTFAIHAACCFLLYLFVRSKVPETRGRSLEEIETMLTAPPKNDIENL